MARFDFKVPVLHLDIAGHKYDVPVNADLRDRLAQFGQEAQRKAALVGDTVDGAREAWDMCAGALDDMLGAGATETIFAGRARDLGDMFDVLHFITAEVRAYAAQATT